MANHTNPRIPKTNYKSICEILIVDIFMVSHEVTEVPHGFKVVSDLHTIAIPSFICPGGSLTTANFEDALIAALAYADSLTTPEGQVIRVPTGDWPMTKTIRLKGRSQVGGLRRAPTIFCDPGTVFSWAALPTGGTFSGAGVCFWLDGGHANGCPIVGGGLINAGIKFTGQHGATAVYCEALVHSQLRNIEIIGVDPAGVYYTNVSGQTGAAGSLSAPDSNGVQTLTGGTGFTQDSEGRMITISGAATGANNGTFLVTSYVSSSSVRLLNASGASDANNGSLTWTEKYVNTGFRFRGDYTNSRGILVTNHQDIRTDNLRVYGMGVGAWFESCTQFTNTHLKIENNYPHNVLFGHNLDPFGVYGGLFQSQGNPTFLEIPGKVGGRHITLRDCYQEGVVPSILKTYPPASGVADYVMENCHQGNSQIYLDLNGTRSMICRNPSSQATPSTAWVKARSCGSIQLEGACFDPFITSPYGNTYVRNTTLYDVDEFSYPGFTFIGRRGLYSGNSVPQKTVNRILFELDLAVEIWDPRVTSSITESGGDLQAITGILNSTVAGPVNSGVYPTWQASNSNFGGKPSWTNTAAAAGLGGMLKATISSGIMPVGSQPGLLIVFRTASAVQDAVNVRYMGFTGADTRQREFHIGDSYTTGYLSLDTYGTNQTVVSSFTTQPQVGFLGIVCREGSSPTSIVHASTGNIESAQVNNFTLTTAGGQVNMGGDAPRGNAALEIAYVALLKRYLSMQEHHALLDAASLEWPGITRY